MRRPYTILRSRPARRLVAVAVALLLAASVGAREPGEPPRAVVGLAPVSFAADSANTERPVPADPRWTIVDLGTLDGGRGMSLALGIDDRREIVGVSTTGDGAYHAFLWRAGRMRDLGVLPGFETGSRTAGTTSAGKECGSGVLDRGSWQGATSAQASPVREERRRSPALPARFQVPRAGAPNHIVSPPA